MNCFGHMAGKRSCILNMIILHIMYICLVSSLLLTCATAVDVKNMVVFQRFSSWLYHKKGENWPDCLGKYNPLLGTVFKGHVWPVIMQVTIVSHTGCISFH